MAVLKKSKLTGRVALLLASPDRKAGLEKQSVPRLDMVFDGIVGDCHSSRDLQVRLAPPAAIPARHSDRQHKAGLHRF
jgi:hypothetical protein